MSHMPARAHHDAFQRLAGNHALTDLDRKLIDAYERLVTDRPDTTDGSVTVTNLCTEARVSRASYYRSPVAAVVRDLGASGQAPRPEIEELRDQVRDLRTAVRNLRRRHADQIRELKATIAAYANQIQVLALSNAELEAANHGLRAQLEDASADVIKLMDRT